MRFTVWSRGRLIGETDLGFPPVIAQARSGWFEPNAEGAKVMPVVAAVLPAMRAYVHRNAVDAAGNRLVQPELVGSTLFADLAEALHHAGALELELRREDGSVVPTEDIGIQDMEQLLALNPPEEVGDEGGPWEWEDDPFPPDSVRAEGDIPLGDDGEERPAEWPDFEEGEPGEWVPGPLELPMPAAPPRYQIHVLLPPGEVLP